MDILEAIKYRHNLLGSFLDHSLAIEDSRFSVNVMAGLSLALENAGSRVLESLSAEIRQRWEKGLCEEDVAFLLKILKDPFWCKYLLSLSQNNAREEEGELIRPTELPWLILRTLYFFDVKRFYPELDEALQTFLLEAMTEKLNLHDAIAVNLALYGHSKILKNPVLLRVYAPPFIGETKKGKKETCPQQDMALLVYNPTEILKKETAVAIVCLNGREFTTLDVSHTRVRMIQRDSLIADTISTGIYESKGTLLGLRSYRPFWQSCTEETFALDALQSNTRSPEATSRFENAKREASRFLGERVTASAFRQRINNALGGIPFPVIRTRDLSYEVQKHYGRAMAVLSPIS